MRRNPAKAPLSPAISGHQLIDELAHRFTLVETGSELSEFHDRRETVRYELEAGSVEVKVSYDDGSSGSALLADVSEEGARMVVDHFPDCGEMVRLSFDLGDHRVDLCGEVRHVGSDDVVCHFGVRFTDSPGEPGGKTVHDGTEDQNAYR